MRGQLSVEMFMAFSLFLFLFGWLLNFLNAFHASAAASTLYSEEKIIATELARLANAACTGKTRIQAVLPCLYAGAQQVPAYSINTSSGPPAISVLATGSNASQATAQTLCPVAGGFPAQCTGANAGQACVWSFNATVRISPGACP